VALKSIRGGRGLGDSLYVQAVARHIINTRGERLQVCADYPDVFRPLGAMVEVVPHRRTGITYLAHYSARKSLPTKQFADCCLAAGIQEPVEMRLDWTPTSRIGEQLKEAGRPIVCVQLPRTPMGRTDGFGAELLPDCRVIQRMIDALRERALLAQIGAGEPLFNFKGIEVDLSNRTTVAELIDVAAAADGFLGYVSFLVPLAESLNKPAMFVWSQRGLKSGTPYVRQITPEKVLFKASSRHVVDNWPTERINEAINAFMR
jgi:hypothetical protein